MKTLLKNTLLTLSCILITALGFTVLNAYSTTTIGLDISTGNLALTGNVTSGTWQGTLIGTQYGGTGQDFNSSTGLLKLTDGTASMITDNSANWDTAYGWGNWSDSDEGFVTASSTSTLTNKDGNISMWVNDSGYLTGNETITLSGDITGSGTTAITTTLGTGIDTIKLADGSVSNTEFQYLNNVTSALQTQLDSKIAIPGSSAQGDILFRNDTDWTRLAAGTTGQFLKTQGASADPAWGNVTRTATFVVATSAAVNGSSILSQQQADYVCDGENDQVEIQAAIDALPDGGGKVVLMEGSFTISSYISMKSNTELVGNKGTKIYLEDESNCIMVSIPQYVTYVTISNIEFDGNKANQSDPTTTPIIAGGYSLEDAHITVKDCHIHNSMGDGVEFAGHGIWIVNNHIHNNTEDEVGLNGADYVFVTGNWIHHDDGHPCICLSHGGASRVIISDNILSHSGTGCSVISLNDDCSRKEEILIANNFIHDSGGYGIEIGTNFKNVNVIGNVLKTGSSWAIIVNSGCERVNIADNVVNWGGSRGISYSGSYGNITGNTIYAEDYGLSVGGNNNAIIGNTLRCGGYGGHYNTNISGSHNRFIGNYLQNTTIGQVFYGIEEGVSADYNIIESNDLSSLAAATAKIKIVGTNTICQSNLGYTTENSGSASVSNGDTIAHGLASTPTYINLTTSNANHIASATSVGSANITIGLINHDGTPIAVDETVYWEAEVR